MIAKSYTFGQAVLCSFFIITMTYAETEKRNVDEHKHSENIHTIYQSMTTEELQKEVEKYSEKGCLSFALGQELIKRWTKS